MFVSRVFCQARNKLPALKPIPRRIAHQVGISLSLFSSFAGQIDHNNIVRSPFSNVDIPEANIYDFITNKFDKFRTNTALVDGISHEGITYDKLQNDIIKVSSALREMGLSKGDVVTLCSPNCVDYPKLFLATVAAGGIVSTCNPTYTPEELSYQLKNSGTKFVATIPALLPIIQQAIQGLNIEKIIVVQDLGETSNDPNIVTMTTMHSNSGAKFCVETVNSKEDIAVLPYSSGTTGLPKGVMLTHYNIIANCCQLDNTELAAIRSNESCLSLLPFFHIYGMVAILFLTLCTGGKQIVLPSFDPRTFLASIQKYEISTANLVPPLIVFLAKHPEVAQYDISSLRSIISGAAPLGGNVVKDAQARIGNAVIRQAYGLTELSPASHCSPLSLGMTKPSSIGPVLPNISCKIVDTISGKALGPDREGEVVIKGPNLMKGYLNMPTETNECIDNEGWFSTGDVGYYDADGHFYITDRLKELIKVKGMQVAPAELEAILLSVPGVVDAAVVGVPHDRLGEAPKAFLVCVNDNITEDQVNDHVKKRLAEHKWLVGGIEFIQQIPKSASGKILRRLLKE